MKKKVLIVLAVLFFASPALIVFLPQENAEKINALLKKIPFIKKEYETKLELTQTTIKIPDKFRSNFFLPGREYSLSIPIGFKITLFAGNLGTARFMTWSDADDLYISILDEGKVVVLPDKDNDSIADEVITFRKNLNKPQGLAFRDGWLYVAEENEIVRMRDNDHDLQADEIEEVVTDLPSGSGHQTRTLRFGPDGKMYVSIGSSCNACEETDPRRAAIVRYDADGSNQEIFATGLRNSVGIAFNPSTDELWGTDNGRDYLGDDLPPDEINIIREGQNYGWPFCYGVRVADSEIATGKEDFCAQTVEPEVALQAHSAPLGLAYMQGDDIPAYLKDKFLVAFHGSWNRTAPTGYKVVIVDPNAGSNQQIENFISGWLVGDEKRGRPVDIIQDNKGAIYISDDYVGCVYKLVYE